LKLSEKQLRRLISESLKTALAIEIREGRYGKNPAGSFEEDEKRWMQTWDELGDNLLGPEARLSRGPDRGIDLSSPVDPDKLTQHYAELPLPDGGTFISPSGSKIPPGDVVKLGTPSSKMNKSNLVNSASRAIVSKNGNKYVEVTSSFMGKLGRMNNTKEYRDFDDNTWKPRTSFKKLTYWKHNNHYYAKILQKTQDRKVSVGTISGEGGAAQFVGGEYFIWWLNNEAVPPFNIKPGDYTVSSVGVGQSGSSGKEDIEVEFLNKASNAKKGGTKIKSGTKFYFESKHASYKPGGTVYSNYLWNAMLIFDPSMTSVKVYGKSTEIFKVGKGATSIKTKVNTAARILAKIKDKAGRAFGGTDSKPSKGCTYASCDNNYIVRSVPPSVKTGTAYAMGSASLTTTATPTQKAKGDLASPEYSRRWLADELKKANKQDHRGKDLNKYTAEQISDYIKVLQAARAGSKAVWSYHFDPAKDMSLSGIASLAGKSGYNKARTKVKEAYVNGWDAIMKNYRDYRARYASNYPAYSAPGEGIDTGETNAIAIAQSSDGGIQ
jgi:hypothetical protein